MFFNDILTSRHIYLLFYTFNFFVISSATRLSSHRWDRIKMLAFSSLWHEWDLCIALQVSTIRWLVKPGKRAFYYSNNQKQDLDQSLLGLSRLVFHLQEESVGPAQLGSVFKWPLLTKPLPLKVLCHLHYGPFPSCVYSYLAVNWKRGWR